MYLRDKHATYSRVASFCMRMLTLRLVDSVLYDGEEPIL